MKKEIKKTKKVNKPDFVVDITKCETPDDVILEFAKTKQSAGFAITDEELETIVRANSCVCIITQQPVCVTVKKKPWYKRLFNWLFNKH